MAVQEWVEGVLVALFAIWPIIGVGLTQWLNRRQRQRGKPELIGRAQTFTQVLLQMYLWPVLIGRGLRRYHNPANGINYRSDKTSD